MFLISLYYLLWPCNSPTQKVVNTKIFLSFFTCNLSSSFFIHCTALIYLLSNTLVLIKYSCHCNLSCKLKVFKTFHTNFLFIMFYFICLCIQFSYLAIYLLWGSPLHNICWLNYCFIKFVSFSAITYYFITKLSIQYLISTVHLHS